MRKLKKVLSLRTAAAASLILAMTSVHAKVDEDVSEEYIEKANKQVKRLADPSSKYKDFVIFADVSPVENFLNKAIKSKNDGKHDKATIYANMANVLGNVAFDRARSRFYQHGVDQFYLEKFKKEIAAQQLTLMITRTGMKKNGAVYAVTVEDKTVFKYKNAWQWGEDIDTSNSLLKDLGKLLKERPETSLSIEYGVANDWNGAQSATRMPFVVKYFTDQMGIAGKRIESKSVGRNMQNRSAIQFTLRGLK